MSIFFALGVPPNRIFPALGVPPNRIFPALGVLPNRIFPALGVPPPNRWAGTEQTNTCAKRKGLSDVLNPSRFLSRIEPAVDRPIE